ncbi:MAG: hypothetical protein CMF39_06415, partial [Legionellaceae bacterium]|nr:hypothetical protein [Legionellaceae bacterium]
QEAQITQNQGELATQGTEITQNRGELVAQGTEIVQNQALDQSQIAQNQAELNEAAMAEGINFQSLMANTSNPFVNQTEAHSIATALGNLDLAEKGKLAPIKPNAATLAATNKKLVMLSSGMFGNSVQAQANAFARLPTTGDELNTRFEQLKTMITLVKVLHDSGQVTQAGIAHLRHFVNENAKELNLPTMSAGNVSQLSREAKRAIAGVMTIKDKNIAFTVANLSNAMMKAYIALLTSINTHADPNITVSLYNLMVSEHQLLVKLEKRLFNTLTPVQKARITKYMLNQQQLAQYHQVLAQPLTARASMLDEEHAKAQRKLIIKKVEDAKTVSDITGQGDN